MLNSDTAVSPLSIIVWRGDSDWVRAINAIRDNSELSKTPQITISRMLQPAQGFPL